MIRLPNLTPEDLFVLLRNIRHVQASGDAAKYLVPDEAIVAFLEKANETLGAEFYKTPRDVVRSFVGLLNILEQNPGRTWQEFLRGNIIERSTKAASIEEDVARNGALPDEADSDLKTFTL